MAVARARASSVPGLEELGKDLGGVGGLVGSQRGYVDLRRMRVCCGVGELPLMLEGRRFIHDGRGGPSPSCFSLSPGWKSEIGLSGVDR